MLIIRLEDVPWLRLSKLIFLTLILVGVTIENNYKIRAS